MDFLTVPLPCPCNNPWAGRGCILRSFQPTVPGRVPAELLGLSSRAVSRAFSKVFPFLFPQEPLRCGAGASRGEGRTRLSVPGAPFRIFSEIFSTTAKSKSVPGEA